MNFKHAFMALLLCPLVATAQDHPVNFQDLDNAPLEVTFPRNAKVRIKVENINRFLYKVTTEKTETDFHMTVPAILSGIKLPAFLTTELPVSGAAPAPVVFDGTKNVAASSWKNEIITNVKELILIQQYLNDAINMQNMAINQSKDCSLTGTQIVTAVKATILAFTTGATAGIPTLTTRLENAIVAKIASAKKISADIESQYSKWKEVDLSEFRTNKIQWKENGVAFKEELTALQARLKAAKPANKPAISEQIKAKEKEIRDHETQGAYTDEDQKFENTQLEETIKKARELMIEIEKFNSEGKTYLIVNNLNKVNEANYTYYTEEVKLKKDETKFVISAVAEGQLSCDIPNEKKFTVKVRTKGGVKLDFSTGVFFNLGSDKFHGEEFYYRPIDSATSSIEKLDGGNRLGLSLGALMHIYKRSPADVKLGLSVGASTTLTVDVLNFHVGPTLLLGDEERFCITGGVTLREIKLLDRRYQVGTSYKKNVLPEAVPTIKKFPKAGIFFSLTYNFTRFNK